MDEKSIQTGTAIALPIPVPAMQLFSHRATNALLALLADNPYALFGVRDLARATDYTHKTISDAVVDLAAADLVETSHEGPKNSSKLIVRASTTLTTRFCAFLSPSSTSQSLRFLTDCVRISRTYEGSFSSAASRVARPTGAAILIASYLSLITKRPINSTPTS